jgi:hypothetical protein
MQLAPGDIGHAETYVQPRTPVRQALARARRLHDRSAPIESAKFMESETLDPFDICARPQLDDNSQFR